MDIGYSFRGDDRSYSYSPDLLWIRSLDAKPLHHEERLIARFIQGSTCNVVGIILQSVSPEPGNQMARR